MPARQPKPGAKRHHSRWYQLFFSANSRRFMRLCAVVHAQYPVAVACHARAMPLLQDVAGLQRDSTPFDVNSRQMLQVVCRVLYAVTVYTAPSTPCAPHDTDPWKQGVSERNSAATRAYQPTATPACSACTVCHAEMQAMQSTHAAGTSRAHQADASSPPQPPAPNTAGAASTNINTGAVASRNSALVRVYDEAVLYAGGTLRHCILRLTDGQEKEDRQQ